MEMNITPEEMQKQKATVMGHAMRLKVQVCVKETVATITNFTHFNSSFDTD